MCVVASWARLCVPSSHLPRRVCWAVVCACVRAGTRTPTTRPREKIYQVVGGEEGERQQAGDQLSQVTILGDHHLRLHRSCIAGYILKTPTVCYILCEKRRMSLDFEADCTPEV